MKQSARKQGEPSWPKTVFKKWLNISNDESDYSADEGDNESDFDDDEDLEHKLRDKERRRNGNQAESTVNPSESSTPYKLRRRNSETLRAQYIDTKELRICVGTWNVGGKLPSDDLDIEEWLDMQEPADIYVLGMQEIVPLNAGNIFGAEDNRPVPQWECLIRDALNRIRRVKPKYKSYSDPPSPSRFKPADDAREATVDELLPETDSDTDDKVHPLDEESFGLASDNATSSADDTQRPSPLKRLQRLNHFSSVDREENPEAESTVTQQKKLARMLSSSERIGLVWPEQSLDLLAKCAADSNPKRLQAVKSFRACKSFKSVLGESRDSSGISSIPEYKWESIVYKRRSPFVRIVSKQMVGIFLSVWVRRSLRKYIQNLKVSTVGVGIMGFIGNKGSVSVSMSIYQTPFCFICSHLSSGEKNGDELRRNADVQEIRRRTRFSTASGMGLPQTILEHERIIWLGDLNYRINLSYEGTHELISKKKWSELIEKDQLKHEFKKGRAFDGWSEGIIKFPPTYKYEFNSEKYIRDDLKGGRRTPAWCDRILSYGTGMKLLSYRRSELKLSDHRPVTATFMAEVEVFSHRKLQKALTLTNAEIEDGEIISDIDIAGTGRLRLGEETSEWGQ
uniref:Type I inositol 1,4,5-trisphosphate 5-phosphatase 1-like isoform X4 n=1 Tax=Albuca bracteata TaxID=82047 RepID=A0A0A7LUC6_ALBBR|nr:type I inositol 1,4,5-trisphosphate 5-phosphatase 1-like isoform X4 [Albuca bracteata]